MLLMAVDFKVIYYVGSCQLLLILRINSLVRLTSSVTLAFRDKRFSWRFADGREMNFRTPATSRFLIGWVI